MKSYSKHYLAIIGALVLVPAIAWNAWAAPQGRPERDKASRNPASHQRVSRKEDIRKPFPRPGEVRSRLPQGRWNVRLGPSRYYYHQGSFYRRGPSGYVVVRAPLGAIVLGLPLGYHRVFIGGGLYFTFGGVYYSRVPSGYVVVSPPPEVAVQEPAPVETPVADDQVSVTAERLNVHSGPGLDQAVIARVVRGTVLVVQESTEDWWYVELPDGKFGWVLARYTTPLQQPASG